MAAAPFDEPEAAVDPEEEGNQEAEPPAREAQAERTRRTKAAMAWLKEQLHDGQPQPAALVEAQALTAGHAHTTLARARVRLGIKSQHVGPSNHWLWIPPARWRKRDQSSAKAHLTKREFVNIPPS